MSKRQQASLYFQQGSSDKEYHAQLVECDGGFMVNFQYGRRGGPLQCGSKTSSPVAIEKARAVFDKLVAEKKSKGYTEGESGQAYQGTAKEAVFTDILPQLLNPIEENEVAAYLRDDAMFLQEKHDGERVLVRKRGDVIIGIQKKGLERPLPLELVAAVREIEGDCLIDGELLSDCYVAFDMLEEAGNDLRQRPYEYRYALLLSWGPRVSRFIRVCASHASAAQKEVAFLRLRQGGREGVVFKRRDAPYSPGRPNSYGDQLKYKFVETATVQVIGRNGDRRSVKMAVYAENGEIVEVGSVTIPPGAEIPHEGQFIEVRYLYAFPGGSLFQPCYLGVRADQGAEDCLQKQLKFKSKSRAA